MIDNTVLRDTRLSWKAKGIMCYILSLPSTWKIYAKEVATHSTDGKASYASGMKELEAYGYIVKTHVRNEHGHFTGYNYMVIEKPGNTTFQPEPDFPISDNPVPDNRTLLSTDLNNNLNNKSISEKVCKVAFCDDTHISFPEIERQSDIFSKTTDEHGEEWSRWALSVIDNYIDKLYPDHMKKKHPMLNKAQRMGFARKILEFMDDIINTAVDDHFDFSQKDIVRLLLELIENANCDPTIFYVTTPKVLGYWLLKQGKATWDDVAESGYEPVANYY